MANGFLSPMGDFFAVTNMNHFDKARELILKENGREVHYPEEPTDVLCDEYGYLYFREHYNGLAGGIREEALDSVYLFKPMTQEQILWVDHHFGQLSPRQQELISRIVKFSYM